MPNGTRLTLPYDIPANEFMNLEGKKISGSRNWAVWGLDFLSRYDPDPLRYYLTANMPESKDTDWDWNDFVRRNNDELVATWGNLANRVLSFAYKNWDGCVPADLGELRPEDHADPGDDRGRFPERRRAARSGSPARRPERSPAPGLPKSTNTWIQAAPWFEIKQDKAAAAKTVYTACGRSTR